MNRIRLAILSCAVAGYWLTSFTLPLRPINDRPIRTVIIDAGHGGKDPGAIGSKHYEKTVNLKVALQLQKLIKSQMPGVQPIMTRNTDYFVALHDRGKIAQEHDGDFFISIHCNSNTNKAIFGSSSFILGINRGQERYSSYIRENESILFEENHVDMYGGFDPSSPEGYIFFTVMKNVFRNESLRLANKIQDQFEENLKRKNRGVKQAPFIVLWQSGMPAILCEIGFISHVDEEKFIASEAGQSYVAAALFRAIKEYNEEF